MKSKETPKEPTGLLHVYAQGAWHEDAYIVGNLEALIELRDKLTLVIGAHGKGSLSLKPGDIEKEELSFWANDGEGYPLHLILLAGEWEAWTNIATPYTEQVAADHRDNAIQPYQMVSPVSEGNGGANP